MQFCTGKAKKSEGAVLGPCPSVTSMAGSCSGRRQVLQVSLRGCILRSEVRPRGGEVWLTAHRCVPCPVEGVLEVGQAHRQTVFHPTMVAPRRGCSRPAHSHSSVHWPAGARGEQNSDPDDQSGERQPWAHSTARGHKPKAVVGVQTSGIPRRRPKQKFVISVYGRM